MGAWGTGIFDNDEAMDVRGIASDLMALGLPPHRVSAILMEDFAASIEEPDFWLGLAMTQHQAGRVDEAVRTKAIGLIETGRALQDWTDRVEAGDRTIQQRQRHLEKARAKLSTSPPAPKRLKVSNELRQRIDRTYVPYPWRLDGIYAYRFGGTVLAFAASVVAEAKLERTFRSTPDGFELVEGPVLNQAVLVLLDYVGTAPPTAAQIRRLQPYSAPQSDDEAEAIARSVKVLHASAAEHAAETFDAFRKSTALMLAHFTPEQLRARFDETKAVFRKKAAALEDTAAAVRRHSFKRFFIDARDIVPTDRLIDLGGTLDTEAAAAGEDYTIQIEHVTWSGLDNRLAELRLTG